jgi:uncharacterized membrane protein
MSTFKRRLANIIYWGGWVISSLVLAVVLGAIGYHIYTDSFVRALASVVGVFVLVFGALFAWLWAKDQREGWNRL